MTTRRLFAVLFGLSLFVLSVRETLDPDLWWHLRTGEFIWRQGRLPAHDVFSFTVPHHEWIVQQWLTDVFMWLVYSLAGLQGLSIIFALVVTAAFLLVYNCCEGQPYLAAFVVLLALLAAALPLGARPQMFNMFFLALFVNILERVKAGRLATRALWSLPLLTVLWANMHSGYLAGIVLLGGYTVGEALPRLLRRDEPHVLSWPTVPRLALVTVACLAAALLNPRGYKLWLFPLLTLRSDAIQSNIVEWGSPDFHLVYFWFFGAMLAVGVVAWLYSRQRPTLTELLIFFGTAAAGLISVRHIPLFAVVTPPIIARHLLSSFAGSRYYPLLSGRVSTPAPVPALGVANRVALVLVLLALPVWLQDRLQNNDQSVASRFPVAAVDFIEQARLHDGRVYNSYEWGGYLIWRRIPVFIDGRTELYGNEFFLYYLQTIRLQETWRQPLAEYEIDYVLVDRLHPLATLLVASGEWRQVYADDVAQVLIRDNSR